MGEVVKPPLENRESFIVRLKDFSWEEKQDILYAYDIAKVGHGNQVRENGIRYFEHPRNTTLILLDECGIRSTTLLKGALLHDTKEDTLLFGNAEHDTYRDSIKIATYRITKTFGKDVAEIVISVSKPKGIDLINLSDDELELMYRRNLEKASLDALLVKMADRLHNLRDIYSCTLEKQQRKVKETEEFYIPLFQKVLTKYPKEGQYLLDQMKIAISKVSLSWTN
jgi:(p)ppGpp synthase/HD superfamily hydrolase